MVMPGASAINIIPGPRPSIAFSPALGLTITDWWAQPGVIDPAASIADAALEYHIAHLGLFVLPFRLAFSKISYYIGFSDGDPIQIGIYSLEGNRLGVADGPAVSHSINTADLSLVLETGFYFAGACLTVSPVGGTDIMRIAGGDIILFTGGGLPLGTFCYYGHYALAVNGILPNAFNPMDLVWSGPKFLHLRFHQ